MSRPLHKNPISKVIWVERDTVIPNEYNPNAQIDSNHELLIESIRETGWTQPIVVRPKEGGGFTIVDGEHRWKASEKLVEEFGTQIPVVVIDVPESEYIAATVRHNRARGSHGIDGMTDIIKTLRNKGVDDGQIRHLLGVSQSELERLVTTEEAFLAIMAGKDGTMEA